MEPCRTGPGLNGLPSFSRSSNVRPSQNQISRTAFGNLTISDKEIIDPATTRHTPSHSSASLPTFSPNPSTELDTPPPYLTRPPTTSYISFGPHPQSPEVSSLHDYSHTLQAQKSQPPTPHFNQHQDPLSLPDSTHHTPIPASASARASMSTLGIHYDARFDAGLRPNSYTWPIFDMPEQYQSQIVGPSDTFDVTVASPETIYAPSLSPSPPQSIFSPEQRELKRQTDQARKASKQRLRRERSSSSSFDMSHTNAPDMIPRSINGNTFTSSMPSMSLPTEPLMPLPSQPYMTGSPVPMPLTSSPAPMSSSESPELYGSQFPMLSNDFGAGSYLMPFSSATSEPSVPSYAAPRPHSLSAGAHDQPYFYRSPPLMAQESSDTIRVVHSRPKPQCWDHGCNGRQFSTFSNLLRHQREKSGVASKPTCPKCGAEFTRTTARNGHMAHEKCKQRRNS